MRDMLPERCLAFIQAQSAGEWGLKVELEDAAKLLAFVRAEIAKAMPSQESTPC